MGTSYGARMNCCMQDVGASASSCYQSVEKCGGLFGWAGGLLGCAPMSRVWHTALRMSTSTAYSSNCSLMGDRRALRSLSSLHMIIAADWG